VLLCMHAFVEKAHRQKTPARNRPSVTCCSNVPLVSSNGLYKHMLQTSSSANSKCRRAWQLGSWHVLQGMIIIQAFNDCCKHANHGLPADKDLLVEICSSHTTAAGAAAGAVPGAVAVAVTNLLSFLQKPSNTMLREILRHAKILILLYKQLA